MVLIKKYYLEHILSLHSKQSLIKKSLRADLFK
jgi:hypothetical protein